MNLERAFSSLVAPSGLVGLIVRLMTGSGTNMLWQRAG